MTRLRFDEIQRSQYRRLCEELAPLAAAGGLVDVTVPDLERLAELPAGTFSDRFSDLEDFLAAVWDAISAELEVLEDDAFSGSAPWRVRVRSVLEAQVDYFALHSDLARLYLAESVFAGERMQRRRRIAIGRMARMIDAGRCEGRRNGAPFAGADAVAGALWTQMAQVVRAGQPEELRERLPEFMYLVVLPYCGSAAAREELAAHSQSR
ncbi:MAG TPA: hypothetical protein VFL77_11255 [Solirubrobacterales bacterium]|nr:hypothetical protein [Solirubrobacterales bacterium]